MIPEFQESKSMLKIASNTLETAHRRNQSKIQSLTEKVESLQLKFNVCRDRLTTIALCLYKLSREDDPELFANVREIVS